MDTIQLRMDLKTAPEGRTGENEIEKIILEMCSRSEK